MGSDLVDLGEIEGGSSGVLSLDTFLVPGGGSVESLLLELLHQGLLGPSDLLGQVPEGAVLSEVLESDDLEGVGDNVLLLDVVGAGHSLEDLQLAEGGGSSGGESGEHTPDHSPEDSRGRLVVHESLPGVVDSSLSQELVEVGFVSEEGAGDVDGFGSDDDDSGSAQESLGHVGSESSEEMALAVNENLLGEHCGYN